MLGGYMTQQELMKEFGVNPEMNYAQQNVQGMAAQQMNANYQQLYNYANDSYPYISFNQSVDSSKIKSDTKPKEINMLTEVRQDMVKFVREHKSVIYWVAVLLIADHFLFQGAFKEKLKNIMNNLVSKVETKLNSQG